MTAAPRGERRAAAAPARGEAVLIDDYLPRYDVNEHHQVRVAAPPARTYAAIWEANLAASAVVRALFALRALPSLFFGDSPARRLAACITLRDVLRAGFFVLGETRGREVVLGVMGSFWKPTGNVMPADRERFLASPVPGTARAAWNFVVEAHAGGTLLSTETRVLCADAASLRSFRRYWFIVGPFSALIRRYVLDSIRATAEAAEGVGRSPLAVRR